MSHASHLVPTVVTRRPDLPLTPLVPEPPRLGRRALDWLASGRPDNTATEYACRACGDLALDGSDYCDTCAARCDACKGERSRGELAPVAQATGEVRQMCQECMEVTR